MEFASDNASPAHPNVIEAVARANRGYAASYGADAIMDRVVDTALSLANTTRGNHQLWPVGSDFQYQNADVWYHNLDKLIHYINLNASRGGPVVAFCESARHPSQCRF